MPRDTVESIIECFVVRRKVSTKVHSLRSVVRLVVCDGKQTCRVVDVERLREEQVGLGRVLAVCMLHFPSTAMQCLLHFPEVEIDRYCSKRLVAK